MGLGQRPNEDEYQELCDLRTEVNGLRSVDAQNALLLEENAQLKISLEEERDREERLRLETIELGKRIADLSDRNSHLDRFLVEEASVHSYRISMLNGAIQNGILFRKKESTDEEKTPEGSKG